MAAAVLLPAPPLAAAPSQTWTRVWGSVISDYGYGVSVDPHGNAYVAGRANSGFHGQVVAGGVDGFLTKHDVTGEWQWTRLIGSASNDYTYAVCTDARGNSYVTGYGYSGFDGETNRGSSDAFLAKFDTAGVRLWTRTCGADEEDMAFGVALDPAGSNVYVAGWTRSDLDGQTNAGSYDAFLTRFTSAGDRLWTRMWGGPNADRANCVAVDATGTNIYAAGYSSCDLDDQVHIGNIDACLVRYSSEGVRLQARIWGSTAEDEVKALCGSPAGGAAAAGYTKGEFGGQTNAGNSDAFLTRFDGCGSNLWSRIWGSSSNECARGAGCDRLGIFHVTGNTDGAWDGQTNSGHFDLFLAGYDAEGTRLWTRIWGTPAEDRGNAIAVDPAEHVYVAGQTKGDLDGELNHGHDDACLTRWVQPDHATNVLAYVRVSGPDRLFEGETAPYTCTAYFVGGAGSNVSGRTVWSLVSAAPPGTAFSSNLLTAGDAAATTWIRLRGEYAHRGMVRSNEQDVTIVDTPTHYVWPGGGDVWPFTNWAKACPALQPAIAAANNGDTVRVLNGTYDSGGAIVAGGITNRIAVTGAVRVESVNGPAVTTVRGGPGVRCAYLAGGAVLAGFTLTEGDAPASGDLVYDQSGGGVWCAAASAVISNCAIVANGAAWNGGGVYGGTLRNCVVRTNTAAHNGGGACESVLYGCVLTGNLAGNEGGGSYTGSVRSCTVSANSAGTGGGLARADGDNSIIYDNTAPTNANYHGCELDYSCSIPMPEGTGNLTNEPGLMNPAGGDFRLRQNSPCIHQGNNEAWMTGTRDLDGVPRIVGYATDIGAYEYPFTENGIPADWLAKNGLATDGTADWKDSDGDTADNLTEWQCETDPWDADSLLRIVEAAPDSEGGVRVKWASVRGRYYTIRRSEDLTGEPVFHTLAEHVYGQTDFTTYLDTEATGTGPYFYQVRLESPDDETNRLMLASNGTAMAQIVALPEAGLVARFAAEELETYLDRVTGADFQLTDTLPLSGPMLLVGDSAESRALGVSVTDLDRDEYVIRRIGDTIVLAGLDDKEFDIRRHAEDEMTLEEESRHRRGWCRSLVPHCATSFAAYDFLERVSGVHWYFPGEHGEYVPVSSNLSVGVLNVRERPWSVTLYPSRVTRRYSYDPPDRYFSDHTAMGITNRDATYWALRMRRSTLVIPMYHMPQSHEFTKRFGVSNYGQPGLDPHPEWFALDTEGQREAVNPPDNGHLCYSSGVVEEIKKDADAYFSGEPSSNRNIRAWSALDDYFSIHPYDGMGDGCRCEACTSRWNNATTARGRLSNLMWPHFVDVAAAVQSNHPNKKLVCFAYNNYRELPTVDLDIPKNLLVGCTAVMREPESWAEQRQIQEVLGWRDLSGQKVYIADYYNLMEILYPCAGRVPQNEYKAMAHFFRRLRNDVVGAMHENCCTNGFQRHVDLYIFFRLRWDPCLEVDAAVDEYCRSMYGPAAGEIKRLLDRGEELWLTRVTEARTDWGGGAYGDLTVAGPDELWNEIYSADEMAVQESWMDTAQAKAAGTPYEARVAFFRQWYFEPLKQARQDYTAH